MFNRYKGSNGELTTENFNKIQELVGLNTMADFSIGDASFGVCDLDGSNGIDFMELVAYISFATQQNQYLFSGADGGSKLLLDFTGGASAAGADDAGDSAVAPRGVSDGGGQVADNATAAARTAGTSDRAVTDVSGQLVNNLVNEEDRAVSIAIRRSDRAAQNDRDSLTLDTTGAFLFCACCWVSP